MSARAGIYAPAFRLSSESKYAGASQGECQIVGGKVAGIAVSIGPSGSRGKTRRSARLQHGQRPRRRITFEDRGPRKLKGVPGEWRLYAVTSHD